MNGWNQHAMILNANIVQIALLNLCNKWLESKCNYPECEYCLDRPERPVNKSN
jgi:hypothetical protein